VLHIKVLDLTQDPPTASTGEQREFAFTYNGRPYAAVGVHGSGAADEFHMESPLRTTVGDPLTGAFDKTRSEVRISVPGGFFSKLKKGPVLTKGSKLVGLAITTRRQAVVIVPNADEAGSLGCPFVVGAQPAAKPTATTPRTGPAPVMTVPSRVDARPVPQHLPATGLPEGLPLMTAGLVLGSALLLRRRLVLTA
jgi:hypothetical protein